MKRFLLLTVLIVFGLPFLAPSALASDGPQTNAPVPGAQLANAISTVTGVAISPLLGASAVGAWKYSHAETPEAREKLPWYAQPWFWARLC